MRAPAPESRLEQQQTPSLDRQVHIINTLEQRKKQLLQERYHISAELVG